VDHILTHERGLIQREIALRSLEGRTGGTDSLY
jgi:hypothetical protein